MNFQEHEEKMKLRGALGYLAGFADMNHVKKYIRDDSELLYRFLADISAIADGALAGKNALDVVREREAARTAIDAATPDAAVAVAFPLQPEE